jgi:hypothetical protein
LLLRLLVVIVGQGRSRSVLFLAVVAGQERVLRMLLLLSRHSTIITQLVRYNSGVGHPMLQPWPRHGDLMLLLMLLVPQQQFGKEIVVVVVVLTTAQCS